MKFTYKIRCYFFLVIMFFIFNKVYPTQENIPTWHWSYDVIEQLQIRGCFTNLHELNRPYSREEIAEGLIDIRDSIKEGRLLLSSTDHKQFFKLVREFKDDILILTGKESSIESLRLGIAFEENINKQKNEDATLKGVYRFQIGADLNDHIGVYNAMVFDQYQSDDPLYPGKKWRDIAAYTEQAYIVANYGKFSFKAGRDFLRWGTGKNGTLLFSDVAQPMDQFLCSFDLGPFRFTSLTVSLDNMSLSPEMADSLGGNQAIRYLAGHRINYHCLNNKLQFALTEILVYGGVNRPLDLVYLNPFLIYHGAQMNKKDQTNPLGTIEVIFYPMNRLQLYLTFLLDDIQVEKTGPGDLEPNEIGWIIGSRWADPFRLSGTTLSAEYVRVANRTYKTPYPWETFIYRNRPLGHPLGNDFDLWQVGLDQWFGADLFFNLSWSQIRKGEGSLYTPWDEPWMDYTVEEGYSEPFPTGIVEKRREISFKARYLPSIHWGLEGDVLFQHRNNADHVKGVTEEDVSWRLGVWYCGDFKITL